MVKKDTLEDPDFRAAFDMLDRNKDGFIDQSELKYFMKQFGKLINIFFTIIFVKEVFLIEICRLACYLMANYKCMDIWAKL